MSEQIKDLFQTVEKAAKADGAQVEMVVSESESFSANYNRGELNKYSFDQANSAGVRVLFGKGAGFSTTEKLSKDALLETYKEALTSAKDLNKTAKADKAAQALYKPNSTPAPMQLISDEMDKVSTEEKLAIARMLETAALNYDSKVQNVPYSRYGESKGRRYLFNSQGLSVSTESGGISAFSYALAKEGDQSKTGGFSTFVRRPKLINAEKIAREAAKRSIELLGATQPKSGTYSIVLFNEVASSLIDFINFHLSAKTIDEGISLLGDQLGQKFFSDKINMIDNPFRTEMGGARPFDSEGAASQKTVMIENGIIRNFMTNSYLAEKMSLPHTANAAREGGEMGVDASNSIIEVGTDSFESLLKADKEVIYITSIDALHSGIKESTLDFSLPAQGFLYRAGEKVGPLHQMVLSGNLLAMMKKVERLSSRHNQDGGSVLSPDFFIPEMSIAGA